MPKLTTKKPLTKSLPEDQAPEGRGFQGNISRCDDYVTDGHVLVLRSAIDPMLAGDVCKPVEAFSRPDRASISAVWNPATVRKSVEAAFLGCAEVQHPFHGEATVGVLRHSGNRIIIIDPWLLRFVKDTTQADLINVDSGIAALEKPAAFYREGQMVALVMPMRFTVADIRDYDFDGESL